MRLAFFTGVATELVITEPTGGGIVGVGVGVTVEARDQYGNRAATFGDTDVKQVTLLRTPGTAQVLTFSSGIASDAVFTTVSQTLALSLQDSASTGLDVSSAVSVDFAHGELACV